MTLSLITGGAGFIGSNLADQLLAMGHKVTVVDNEYSDAHDQFYWNENTYNVNCDIRDYKALKNCMHGVDYVFHFAAEARIQPAIKNPIEAVSINSLGTCTVLQCAKEAGVKKVMYSSTSAGYGLNPYPNVEPQPDDCLNPYPDDVEEYITFFTPASLAHCKTVQVPNELMLTASIGFLIAGCILASAAK